MLSLEKILFGPNAPLFCFASAKLKLRESVLTPEQRRAGAGGNAQNFLQRKTA